MGLLMSLRGRYVAVLLFVSVAVVSSAPASAQGATSVCDPTENVCFWETSGGNPATCEDTEGSYGGSDHVLVGEEDQGVHAGGYQRCYRSESFSEDQQGMFVNAQAAGQDAGVSYHEQQTQDGDDGSSYSHVLVYGPVFGSERVVIRDTKVLGQDVSDLPEVPFGELVPEA